MLTPPQLPAHLPPGLGNDVEHILASIPPPRLPPVFDRNCLVIIGKPGCGKTTLAKRIANAMSLQLVNPEFILENVLTTAAALSAENEGEEGADHNDEAGSDENPEGNPPPEPEELTLEEEVLRTLKSGKEISSDLVLKFIEQAANSDDALYKGYVLDGLPHTGPHPKPQAPASEPLKKPGSSGHHRKHHSTAQKETSGASNPVYADLDLLKSLVKSNEKGFRYILVNLSIDENDLIDRREHQWLDPKTGAVYPGPQVSYSHRRRAEGWTDGSPDAEALREEDEEEESWAFDINMEDDGAKLEASKLNEEGGEGEEGDQEEGGQEDAEGKAEQANGRIGSAKRAAQRLKRKLAGEPKKIRLENKATWPILPKEVLTRLIRRREDTYDEIVKEVNEYISLESQISELTAQLFDHMAIVNIDATQHPDTIARNVIERLQAMGVATFLKPVVARRLQVAERALRGVPEADVVNYLSTFDLDDGEPNRELSMWGRYCPVRHYEENTLTQAPMAFPVTYRGQIYFLDNEDCANRFISNPDRFLSKPPRIPSLTVCILGGPFTGKTTQSSLLAKVYGLRLLSVDDILDQWSMDPDQAQLLRKNPIYAQIVKRCKAGRSVSPELMVDVLKYVLEEGNKENTEDKPEQGWVLDGFPRTLDQASAMIAAGIIPQYAMVLTNDINDEIVRMRLKFHQANSRTGLVWNERTKNDKPASPPQISVPTTPGQASGANTYTRTTPYTQPAKPSSAGFRNIQPTPPVTAPPPQNSSRPISGRPSIARESAVKELNQEPAHLVEPVLRSPYAMPPIPIAMYPFFDNLYNGFREEFQPILKLIQENSSMILNIAADQAIPTVLSMIQTMVDPFLPKAKALSGKEVAELPAQFEFGFTKDFCPFALRQANILQKGDSTIVAKYESRIYYFSSDEARMAFLIEPHNFVNFRSPMNVPPPRLFFLGPSGSGKTTLMQSLVGWDVPSLTFKTLVEEYCKIVDEDEREEIEYMMRENAGVLSPLIVQDLATFLFQKEPYASKGFLLEGFPRTKVEAEVLIKHNLFVDAFINISVEPDVAAKRIVKDLQNAVKAAKENVLNALKNFGEDHPNTLEARNAEAEALKRFSRPADEILEELIDTAEKENMRVSEVVSSVEGNWTVPVIELDGGKCIRPRKSTFSNAIRIEKSDAEVLLRLGIKSYSSFGQYCPVSMAKTETSLTRQIGNKPIIYGDHIYFLKNEANCKDFLENTLEFVSQPAPKPIVRPKVCVIGRPKSGKTTLSLRACADLELIPLTLPRIIESLLSKGEHSNLSKKIHTVLAQGLTLPDELKVDALLRVTSRGICQAKGWILDDFPHNLSVAESLEKRGFIPHLIIQLDIMDSSMIKRALEDFKESAKKGIPDLNFEPVIRDWDDYYRGQVSSLQNFYDRRYANWVTLDASKSKWSLKTALKSFLEGGTTRRQNYVDLRTKGRAAPVGNIGLSLSHLSRQMGKFGDYCPVNLLDRGELVKGPMDTTFTAEYQNRYYRMADAEALNAFLESPEKYILGPDLPESLPERRPMSILSFPRQLELQGFCPVTYFDGPQGQSFGSMVTGRMDMIVEYENKLYAMTNEEKLLRFMRTPWVFINLELPKKLPPKLAPIPIGTLPLIGYLEQTVARTLSESLCAVGSARPKYPYFDLKRSACEYLALYLKANNVRSKEWVRQSFKSKLSNFRNGCDLLMDLTKILNSTSGSFVPLDHRDSDIDRKLNMLIELRAKSK
ncbi:adenylate kinase [Phlyctochytrium planicorne]|nr:adenylate kinase [Phlyctochytrium planicorne]